VSRDRVDLPAIVKSLEPNFDSSLAFDVAIDPNSDQYVVRAVRGGAYGVAYIKAIELWGARPGGLSAILREAMDQARKHLADYESGKRELWEVSS